MRRIGKFTAFPGKGLLLWCQVIHIFKKQALPINKAAPVALFTVGAVPVLRFDADSKALTSYFDALGKRFDVIEGSAEAADNDINDHAEPGSATAKALAEMKAVEPQFAVGPFLTGAKSAYEMILMAFERGDLSDVRAFLAPPVAEAFDTVIADRKAKADSEIADAQKLRTEAEAMKAEYEQNLQNARTEANQIVAAAQKTAAARSEELLGEARAQAAALKQKAEADIAQERKKAVNEVKDEIGGIAMEIASKVVEREISEKDHKDLIDEFIKNVGEAS